MFLWEVKMKNFHYSREYWKIWGIFLHMSHYGNIEIFTFCGHSVCVFCTGTKFAGTQETPYNASDPGRNWPARARNIESILARFWHRMAHLHARFIQWHFHNLQWKSKTITCIRFSNGSLWVGMLLASITNISKHYICGLYFQQTPLILQTV